jgi:cell division protein FtsW
MKAVRNELWILTITLLLTAGGLVMVYSASSILAQERFNDGYFFLRKQAIFAGVGFLAMILLAKVPYTAWRHLAYPSLLVSFSLLLLLCVPGFGMTAGGATRWLRLGGFAFQVTEVAKLSLVLFLAAFLARREDRMGDFRKIFTVPLLFLGVMVLLVLRQPDFGTSALLCAVFFLLFYLAGCRLLHLAGLLSLAVPAGLYVLFFEPYRLKRILAFLKPWEHAQDLGFHIVQSFIAFGSGGLFGVGLGNGTQKLFYLPEPHTDFVLAVIAEEMGLLGVSVLLVLFAVLIVRGFVIASRTNDRFGSILASGLTALIALEVIINMGCAMGLLPTKGLPLPFVSYGGTSLVASLAAMGILMNISRSHREGDEAPEGGAP